MLCLLTFLFHFFFFSFFFAFFFCFLFRGEGVDFDVTGKRG